jgi:hypothetical protein
VLAYRQGQQRNKSDAAQGQALCCENKAAQNNTEETKNIKE